MSESLYGKKKTRQLSGKAISASNSASFSSSLSSLISGSTSKITPAQKAGTNPAKTKPDIFTAHKAKKRPAKDIEDDRGQKHKTEDEIGTTSSTELQRSKRRLEEKVRLYNAMKRGEYVQRDNGYDDRGLVDFDRKWAEQAVRKDHSDISDHTDDSEGDSDDDNVSEVVTYIDEFGRTRKGTKKQAEREARERRISQAAAIDRANFAAHPEAPSQIIYGDTVQYNAFNPDRDIAQKMAELAKKRDRSATPPPETHFDASAEVRTKGTGFYTFSHDAEQRRSQMEALAAQRMETEKTRQSQSDNKTPVHDRPLQSDGEEATHFAEPVLESQVNAFLDSIEFKPK